MKLDDTDKLTLYELERNARISDIKLSKVTGKSKDAVRYRIKKLENEGIIEGYTTWIDFTKLGYQTGKIYLTLVNLPKKRVELIEKLKNDKRVFWLGIAEGAWNIGITFFVKSTEEFFNIKNKLLADFSDLIIDVKVASLVSLSFHEKSFLIKQKSSLATMISETSKVDIDDLSKEIIKDLYANSRENIATIAIRHNTTVDIVRTRIKRLEESKIISKYTIRINYHKIGYEFYKAFIYLKDFKEVNLSRIMAYAERSINIINIVKQISSWDFEFVIFAQNFAEYNKTISEFTERFSESVLKIETAVMSEDILFPAKSLVFE